MSRTALSSGDGKRRWSGGVRVAYIHAKHRAAERQFRFNIWNPIRHFAIMLNQFNRNYAKLVNMPIMNQKD